MNTAPFHQVSQVRASSGWTWIGSALIAALLASLPLLGGETPAGSQASGPKSGVRLAVVTGLRDQETLDVLALAEIRISSMEGVALLERKDLDPVLAEHELTLSGLVDATMALRLGKLLTVDLLAVVEGDPKAAKHAVWGLVVFDARTGARLFDEAIAATPADKAVDAIDRGVRTAAAKHRLGREKLRTLSVPSVRNVDLPLEQDVVCGALGRLLEQRLTASPDLAVLERRYLEHVLRERAASPDAPANALLASMNTVQLELSRRGENGISVAAILDVMGREPRRVEVLAADGLNAAMADALASRILDELQATDSKGTPNRRMDALRMIEEAEYHLQNRHYDESLACAEASLALEPDDPTIWGRAAGCFAAWIEVTIQAWPKTQLREGPYRFRLTPPSEEEHERTTALFLRTVELWIKCREWEIGRGGLRRERPEHALTGHLGCLHAIDSQRNSRTATLLETLERRYLYLWWELIGGQYRAGWSEDRFDGRSAFIHLDILFRTDDLCSTPETWIDLLVEHGRLVADVAERQGPAIASYYLIRPTHIWLLSPLLPNYRMDASWRLSAGCYQRLEDFFSELASHPRPSFQIFAQVGKLWVETRLRPMSDDEMDGRVRQILVFAQRALDRPNLEKADLERAAIYEALLYIANAGIFGEKQQGPFLDDLLEIMLARKELTLAMVQLALLPQANRNQHYETFELQHVMSRDVADRDILGLAIRTKDELAGLFNWVRRATSVARSSDARVLDGERTLVLRHLEEIERWYSRWHPQLATREDEIEPWVKATRLFSLEKERGDAAMLSRPVVHGNAAYVLDFDLNKPSVRLHRLGLDDKQASLVSELVPNQPTSMRTRILTPWWSGPLSIVGQSLCVATPCLPGIAVFPLDGSPPKHVIREKIAGMPTDHFDAVLALSGRVFALTSEPASYVHWHDRANGGWQVVASSRRIEKQTLLDQPNRFDTACFYDGPRKRVLFGVRDEAPSDRKSAGLYQFALEDRDISRIAAYATEAPVWMDRIDDRRLWAAFPHMVGAELRTGVLYELDLTTDRWREVFRAPEYRDHDIHNAEACSRKLAANQNVWGPFAAIDGCVWCFDPLARIDLRNGSVEKFRPLPVHTLRTWGDSPTFNELRFLPERRAVLYATGWSVWLLELPEASAADPAGAEAMANREGATENAVVNGATNHANTPVGHAGLPAPGAAIQRERAPAKEPDGAGLVAHWRLDDGQGTSAANAAGNGHVGTLEGGPAWSKDAPPLTGLRGSLAFDGVAAMVQMTSDPALNPTGSFSLAAWVKIEGEQAGGHTVISSRDQLLVDGVYTLRGFILRATADSRWQFMLGDEHAWHYTTSNFIPNARWTHLVATFEQTDVDGAVAVGVSRLFADGALVATKHNARYKAAIDGHPTRIGAGENEKPSGGHRMHGNIAEVRIYHRLLSDDEISAMCPWR